jgi:hypothetical protein
MTNKLRTVHINSVEWKYAISNGNVRIYEPGTKQIKATVALRDLPDTSDEEEYYDGNPGYRPSDVKKYIMDNLI